MNGGNREMITCYKCLKKHNNERVEALKDSHGKSVFLLLSTVSLSIVLSGLFLATYLVIFRLNDIHFALPIVVQIAAFLFAMAITGGLFLIALTVITERDFLYPHGEKSITVKVLYPISYYIAKLFKISRERLGNSFVEVNNAMIRALARAGRVKAEKILILLPHCIQFSECNLRVTNDISNCKECGKCDISEITALKKKFSIDKISVANGGTLARKIIIDLRPNVIIAVACERDLVEGIQDAYPIPVYGILNIRVNGPCYNTIVPTDELETALEFITKLR